MRIDIRCRVDNGNDDELHWSVSSRQYARTGYRDRAALGNGSLSADHRYQTHGDVPVPLEQNQVNAPATPGSTSEPLPPWVVVGGDYYGHKDWRIDSIVGQWILVAEKSSPPEKPNQAWVYLPTGVIYGNTTLLRRSDHGVPVATR